MTSQDGHDDDLERGLRFTHVMMMVTQEQASEAMAYVQAILNMLSDKGLIKDEEVNDALDEARRAVGQLSLPRVRLADMGDKYALSEAVEIDCASRIPLCQGRCCAFKFYLTKQDLDEGVARWDYGNPYWVLQRDDDGYCVHSAPHTRFCTIHVKRPHVCRKYDCRHDQRIWIDFEARIPAPLPDTGGNAPIAMAEAAMQQSLKDPNTPKSELLGFD
jgi:Fe-S-cluster containining protein